MKYIFTIVIILVLSACGGTSDNKLPEEKSQTASNIIDMELNRSYTVYKGDTLTKTSSDAIVSVLKLTQSDISTVELLEGSAQITRTN